MSASDSVSVQPVELLVFTVTVSLELLTTPPGVGVILIATGVAVDILMTCATVTLMIVLELVVAAEAVIGKRAIKLATPATTARLHFILFVVSQLS